MLIVMEYRNVANLLELSLDLKAARRGDILQINAAERTRNKLDGAYDLVHILGGHAQRERIHIRKRLEQRAFALHHRHAGDRADIAQAEYRCAVRNNRNQVMPAGISIAQRRVILNFKARLGHARRIGDRKVLLAVYLTPSNDLDLAAPLLMRLERAFFQIHIAFLHSFFAPVFFYRYFTTKNPCCIGAEWKKPSVLCLPPAHQPWKQQDKRRARNRCGQDIRYRLGIQQRRCGK